jgi:hypothetical protein
MRLFPLSPLRRLVLQIIDRWRRWQGVEEDKLLTFDSYAVEIRPMVI